MSHCSDCIYYKHGICYNIESPLMSEEVEDDDRCDYIDVEDDD